MRLLDEVPLGALLVAALLLGLAPLVPEPHVWQKLKMLADGSLTAPIDIFDLLLHGAPWVLLGLKLYRIRRPG
ncbi:MAG: RND transporter [Chromatiaceae bacterium]|nr:RND transporter [Chromatiaceae bacterium]